MAGLTPSTPLPLEITLHERRRTLGLRFDDGLEAELTHEFLRVFSPSAEVRGHGPGQEVLQTGKRDVSLTAIEPVGQYAVKLVFSDGHDSGLYSWDHLYTLARDHDTLWADYLARLAAEGAHRDPAAPVPEHLRPAPRQGCGKH
ncbi:MAG: DUF971 domain-containing protein [Candidatus Dactylopiibacterium sp.]|nr:DUF971 domain-containing protein [Candidatus Dactylopiibacterium sp.]